MGTVLGSTTFVLSAFRMVMLCIPASNLLDLRTDLFVTNYTYNYNNYDNQINVASDNQRNSKDIAIIISIIIVIFPQYTGPALCIHYNCPTLLADW